MVHRRLAMSSFFGAQGVALKFKHRRFAILSRKRLARGPLFGIFYLGISAAGLHGIKVLGILVLVVEFRGRGSSSLSAHCFLQPICHRPSRKEWRRAQSGG